MTCDLRLRDARSVARIINLAHRFNCRCTKIAADAVADGTVASFAFDGPEIALSRLRAQIARIVSYEAPAGACEAPSALASPEGRP